MIDYSQLFNTIQSALFLKMHGRKKLIEKFDPDSQVYWISFLTFNTKF